MKIKKTASHQKTNQINMFYYRQAREGMHDAIQQMHLEGLVNDILLPGYIGWSPKEGSGIFDSITTIEGIHITYYKMKSDLSIDKEDLYSKIKSSKCLVLLVNYFGFRDPHMLEIIDNLKKQSLWVMEDNAHGFYTWHENSRVPSDLVIFSLHKMFPFKEGGSLVIQTEELDILQLQGSHQPPKEGNPYSYHIHELAQIRKDNFIKLSKIIAKAEAQGILVSLRKIGELEKNIPQTYPIVLKTGNRNKVYQLMNDAGYGVVSLYHTLIEPLQCHEFEESLRLSRHIMNLPVHQDVDNSLYSGMVDCLIQCCLDTKEEKL